MLKTAIILLEHDQETNQKEFEESLISHSHSELAKRVKNSVEFKTASVDNEFLSLLGRFYKSIRYCRYGLETSYESESMILKEFLEKHLNVQFRTGDQLFGNENTRQFKQFIGRRIKKITHRLFDIVWDECHRLNLYSYELRSDSKAAKVFLAKQFDFEDEEILWKELLVFVLNFNQPSGMLDFIKHIPPLDFDIGLVADYLKCFGSDLMKSKMDEDLDCLYEEVVDKKERFEMLKLIANPNVFFGESEEE